MMSNLTRALIGALATAIATADLLPAQAHGQEQVALPKYRARLLGVYDDASGSAIEGVRVLALSTGMSAETSTTGTVALFFLPDGGGLVRLQKIGYEVQTLLVAISPSDTAPLTLTMRRVTELAPVVTNATGTSRTISPALRGFEERRKIGFGSFIGEDVLRANEEHLLADVLKSRAPGMVVLPGRGSATLLASSARCMAGGPPQVVLDGVPLSPDPPPNFGTTKNPKAAPPSLDSVPFDLSRFDVSSLAAVEWYADGDIAPIEFAHTSARCGLLMLWSRER